MEINVEKNGNKIWELAEKFFLAKFFFQEIFDKYEKDVIRHSKERGIDRTKLRLKQTEVSKLLVYSKLVDLRNSHLLPLKDLAHEIFRHSDSTDPFDRWVNSIFHEISILKEEHYRVKRFAAEYEKAKETEESTFILDEVHEAFPRIVHHVHNLFGKATRRLEQILPQFKKAKVFIRSVYLFGGPILSKAYEGGMAEFYRKIYDYGPFEGYLAAAESFLQSGFYQEAKEALEKVEEYREEGDDGSEQFQKLSSHHQNLHQKSHQLNYSPL